MTGRATPWAIMLGALPLQAIVLEGLAPRPLERMRRGSGRAASVAVVPLLGILTQRRGFWTDTASDEFRRDVARAVADPGVSVIVLEIDSPGGEVYGTTEAAAVVRNARNRKPVIAVANSLAASAAYWIGSQASEFVLTPGGEVGSIGVLAVHTDASRAYEAAGVTNTVLRAGRFKGEGNRFEPLGDPGREALQRRIDESYRRFVADVGAGRGVPVDVVRERFGQGRVVAAAAALTLGMVDRVATFEQILSELSGPGAAVAHERAALATRARLNGQRVALARAEYPDLDRRFRELELDSANRQEA